MKQKSVSATYLKTFLQCPQKFYYKYQEKKTPVETGDARAFGTAVHEALEKMYTRLGEKGAAPDEEDYNYVYDVFLDSAIDNQLIDQGLYDEGRQMLKARLDAFDPTEKVVGLELLFGFRDSGLVVTTERGTPLIGAIDKVVELDKDTVVVIDYKTSRTALTDDQSAKDEQMSLYDLAISKLYPQYKNIIMVFDYLRLSPVITHRTPEQRANFEKFIDKMYDKIGEMDESEVKPKLNEFCGWCDYKAFCPKFTEYVNNADILLKPLGAMGEEEFVSEWGRFMLMRKIVDSYHRDLKMHAVNISQGDKTTLIKGSNKTLYQTQVSRVYYNSKTLLDIIPKEDCHQLISVRKEAVDKYLADRPEYADEIAKTAKVSYQSPFFKIRKKKAEDGS